MRTIWRALSVIHIFFGELSSVYFYFYFCFFFIYFDIATRTDIPAAAEYLLFLTERFGGEFIYGFDFSASDKITYTRGKGEEKALLFFAWRFLFWRAER